MIRLKRAYEKASPEDGVRILVERLWPRAVSKEKAKIDIWCKEVAPSTELRRWHHAHLDQWDAFVEKYLKELKTKKEVIEQLKKKSRKEIITFVYATRNEKENNAVVLKEVIEGRLKI